jgi:hypothetical protein
MCKCSLARAGSSILLALICGSLSLASQRLSVSEGSGAAFRKRSVSYTDLSADMRARLPQAVVGEAAFTGFIAEIDRTTVAREIDGEYDHLIFYLLQSNRFTTEKRIEPALSAYEFVRGLSPAERSLYLAEGSRYVPPVERFPRPARARIMDFINAINRPTADERLAFFRGFLNRTAAGGATIADRLSAEYSRCMRFLYEKEFTSRELANKEEIAAYVASLYQDRGHSTDTQIEANFALYIALSALKAEAPTIRIEKVLIVGPGLDFAPRTDLIDVVGPQSYQPFAVADALLGLKLSDVSRLSIHCVDINERVVDHLQGLAREKEIRLSLISGVGDSAARPLADDYKNYFRALGNSIGSESTLEVPGKLAAHLKKSLRVRPEIVRRISADRFNVITERYDPSPGFDLVVVTNVFPYFKPAELLLALDNIAAMTAAGGHLIHNELQAVPASFTEAAGLPIVQARTVLIAAAKDAPLFDGVAIHRKVRR